MEFGIQIEPQFGYSFDDIRDIAREAEANAFVALWCSDHLFLNLQSEDRDCLETWTLLAALSQQTTTLRLGTMVTAQSYRNPALLAKIAAGVDVMSGGRLEFGIGAGWKEMEYKAYGYEFPPANVRVDQLVETIEICRRMWTEKRPTFHGKHYRIDGALSMPKPAQRPHPRVWIGGSRPRVLRIMAKYADAVNIGGFPTLENYREAMAALDEACRALGRDPRQITRSHFVPCAVAETRRDLDRVLDEVSADPKTPGQWRPASPGAIVGTPDEVIERLRALAKAGCSYFLPLFPYRREREMARIFGKSVIPALR
jgi:F420-dependent oxidoreductase-like protein